MARKAKNPALARNNSQEDLDDDMSLDMEFEAQEIIHVASQQGRSQFTLSSDDLALSGDHLGY